MKRQSPTRTQAVILFSKWRADGYPMRVDAATASELSGMEIEAEINLSALALKTAIANRKGK